MKSLDKKTFYVETLYIDLAKGDEQFNIQTADRISRKIEKKPEILNEHPDWQKYRDFHAKQAETRKENNQSKPGIRKEKDEEDEQKSEDFTLGPKEKRVPVYRNHKGKPTGKIMDKGFDFFLELPATKVIDEIINKGKDGHVASVAVMDGTKMLMGKRRDNGKYTIPGGHLDEGEKKTDGAVRELHEEAGIVIDPKKLKHLGSKKLKTFTGKEKTIHAFVINHKGPTTTKNDPDEEVEKWHWIETKGGLPEHVITNLHSPKNVVLEKLGLLEKSFFIDLLKSGPHKYIRKYQRGGKWVYVYHEAEQHGRAIPEEAVQHLKELAEAGDEHAKKMVEGIQPHSEEKLKILRELADAGDVHAKEHLKTLGIHREQEKLEEKLIPQQVSNDPIDEKLGDIESENALRPIQSGLKSIFHYLAGHQTSPYSIKLRDAGLTTESIMDEVEKQKTLRGMLKEFHKQMKKVDAAHKGLPATQNSDAARAGGYGTLAYNKAVKALEDARILPQGYSEAHTRGQEPHGIKEHEAKMEEKRAEQEAQDRRDLKEVHGSMAHFMGSIMDSSSLPTARIKELHKELKNIFGKDLRKEDWFYDFKQHGLTTKIQDVRVHRGVVELTMQVYDSDGKPTMQEWRRTFSKKDGRPDIHNDIMVVKPNARGTVQVGNLINQGQRSFLKSLPQGGVISVYAALDVGGYNWANQGFSFQSASELSNYRYNFQRFASQYGINLKDEDLEKFKEPVHFAAFNDGKKYIKTLSNAINLSQQQIDTKSLSGVPGEHTLTRAELSSGKANRMAVHLGKLFMLGRNWYGVWDSKEDTVASKFADKYYQLRERAAKVLDSAYTGVVQAARAGERAAPVRDTRTVTRRDSLPRSAGQSSQLINMWTRRGIPGAERLKIRITAQRLERIKRLPIQEIEHFVLNANITTAARRQIRRAVQEMRARG